MVATVINGGADDDHGEPEPCDREMRSSDYWPSDYRTKIDNGVLKGVTVDRSHTHWCRPLVVSFVNVFVELWMMEQSRMEEKQQS